MIDSLFGDLTTLVGLLTSVVLTVAGYLIKRYVVPFLQVGTRLQYARYLAAIADDLTDELRAKYPEKEWLTHLDEAVDRLIEMCGISREVAGRVVSAAASRR
jgi:hypothetical protein